MTERKKRWPKVLAWVFGLPTALILLLAIVIVIVEGGATPTTTQKSAVRQEAAVRKPDLELMEDKVERDEYGNRYIVGTVKNNRNRKYSYAQITFTLHDESGAQVGTALDNINNLEAGGVWRFKAVVLEDNASKYKLSELSGW